jgi:membrane protein YqaA with SNARE-associated domain
MITELIYSLVQTYGYLGIFLASLIGSLTIILPTPYLAIVFSAGSVLDPFLVGIVAGVGSSIGEMTSYFIGLGGNETILKKHKTKINKMKITLQKHGWDLGILVLSISPIPFDLVGLFCGSIKYDIKKFFLLTLVGKLVKHLIIAYAGFYGIQWIFATFI